MNRDPIGLAFGEDEKALILFNEQMASFNQAFLDAMVKGLDYTLSLEVRGDKGILIHCRVKTDKFDRPKEKESKKALANKRKDGNFF